MEQQLHGGLGWQEQEVDLVVALQGFAYNYSCMWLWCQLSVVLEE